MMGNIRRGRLNACGSIVGSHVGGSMMDCYFRTRQIEKRSREDKCFINSSSWRECLLPTMGSTLLEYKEEPIAFTCFTTVDDEKGTRSCSSQGEGKPPKLNKQQACRCLNNHQTHNQHKNRKPVQGTWKPFPQESQ